MANEKPAGRTTRAASSAPADATPTEPAVDATPTETADDTNPDQPAGDRVAELEAENERLRQRMAAAGVPADDPRKPREPSFGISEGTREELARTGKANSPFTGRKLTRDDLPS